MPTPGQKPDVDRFQDEMLQKMFGMKHPDHQLAHEVAELRREIQSLRHDLVPSTGQVMTGPRVVAEFERLTKG